MLHSKIFIVSHMSWNRNTDSLLSSRCLSCLLEHWLWYLLTLMSFLWHQLETSQQSRGTRVRMVTLVSTIRTRTTRLPSWSSTPRLSVATPQIILAASLYQEIKFERILQSQPLPSMAQHCKRYFTSQHWTGNLEKFQIHVYFLSPANVLSEYIWNAGWQGGPSCTQCLTASNFVAAAGSQILYAMGNPDTAELRVGFVSAGAPTTLTEAVHDVGGEWQLGQL